MARKDPIDQRHHVVIIGSGFGGLFAARRLRKVNVRVTMIARTNHHLFQPLLYQLATGILSQGEIAPATREVLKRQKNATVVIGEVTDIDVKNQTVTHGIGGIDTVTSYDSLIVAAGAGQSYFGNDHFEQFAPGLKTIDDALEIRGRIYGAFDIAERQTDPVEAQKWMTFVVVGAGATGVEIAGQIRELARRALPGEYRNIKPEQARVVLVDAGDAVLSSFGPELSEKAKRNLEHLGVEVHLNTMVTDMDARSVVLKHADGSEERVEAISKVWAAGVAGSPLGKVIADQTGTEVDRAGRIKVQPDLTVPGHPEVFVIGDMIALDDLPGVAQVAMQGGKYSADQIRRRVQGDHDAGPFEYFDKGSMATISRFKAVAKVGPIKISGFIAWLMWVFIHILYLVGFRNQIQTLGHWFVAFIGRNRSERTYTTFQSTGAVSLINGYIEEHPSPDQPDHSVTGDEAAYLTGTYLIGPTVAPDQLPEQKSSAVTGIPLAD